MALTGWNNYNKLKLVLDTPSTTLSGFPLPIKLSNSCGKNSFNASDLFTELEYTGNIDDDFVGNNGYLPNKYLWEINPDLWNNSAIHDIDIEIYNNNLRFTTKGNADDLGQIRSYFIFKGDLDVETKVTFSSSGTIVPIFYIWANEPNRCYIKLDNVNDTITANSSINNVWDSSISTSTTFTECIVRMVRSGNTIKYYYNIGGGEQYLGSQTCTTLDVKVVLHINGDNSTADYIDYNYFKVNSGNYYWDCQHYPNMYKIAVTDENDNFLYTEVDYWSHGDKEIQLWSKLPTISSGTNTTIYLYYDKNHEDNTYIGETGTSAAKQVWNSNFEAVYLFSQDPSVDTYTILDSTSNENHGTALGDMTKSDLVDGITGKGINLDGTDDVIRLPGSIINPNKSSWSGFIKSSVGGVVVARGGDGESIDTNIIQFKTYTNTNNPPSRYFFETGAGDNHIIDFSETFSDNTFTFFHMDIINDGVKLYKNGELKDTRAGIGNAESTAPYSWIGDNGAGNNENFEGTIDQIFIYNETPDSEWIKTIYKASLDNFITFDYYVRLSFDNSSPSGGEKVYGKTQTIKSTVTLSGIDDYNTYIADFYLAPSNQHNTLSGISFNNEVSTNFNTISGIDYNWYMTVTTSGYVVKSDIYNFYVRYLCSGICYQQGIEASGINVRLYRRSDGSLVGQTTTAGTGTFSIDTIYNEQHYAIALHPTEDYNALIYDYLEP